MADYSAAIMLNPSHYRAYYNRAFAHDRLARYDLAARQGPLINCHAAMRQLFSMALRRCACLQVTDYTQALNLQPGNAMAYHNRGAYRS